MEQADLRGRAARCRVDGNHIAPTMVLNLAMEFAATALRG